MMNRDDELVIIMKLTTVGSGPPATHRMPVEFKEHTPLQKRTRKTRILADPVPCRCRAIAGHWAAKGEACAPAGGAPSFTTLMGAQRHLVPSPSDIRHRQEPCGEQRKRAVSSTSTGE